MINRVFAIIRMPYCTNRRRFANLNPKGLRPTLHVATMPLHPIKQRERRSAHSISSVPVQVREFRAARAIREIPVIRDQIDFKIFCRDPRRRGY